MSMHQVGRREHQSAEKLLGYVGLLTKEKIEVVFENKYPYTYHPAREVVLSPTLFQTDSCHSSGKCCKVPFDLIYTHEGIERIKKQNNETSLKLLAALKAIPMTVNSKDVDIWCHLNDTPARYTGQKTCDFLEHPDSGEFAGKFICGLHGGYNKVFESMQPVHCIMPHMVVRKSHDGTSFAGRMQFGRNWRFGCPVVFEKSEKYFAKDYQQDIDKLTMLNNIADDIKVETWIPEMIDWLKNNRDTIEKMIKTGEYMAVRISKGYNLIYDSAPLFIEDSIGEEDV